MIAAYTRNDENGLQKEMITKRLAAQGLTVDRWYSDNEVDKVELGRLEADAEKAKFNTVVVTSIDRITRSVVEWVEFTNRLKEAGVAVTVITFPHAQAEHLSLIEISKMLQEQIQEQLTPASDITKDLKEFQKRLTDEERVAFWDDLQDGYCRHCGQQCDHVCHCTNDE